MSSVFQDKWESPGEWGAGDAGNQSQPELPENDGVMLN